MSPTKTTAPPTLTRQVAMLAGRGRRDMSSRVKDVVLALALCHNVSPVVELDGTITYQSIVAGRSRHRAMDRVGGAEPRRSRSHIHVASRIRRFDAAL